jgi:hypothetical protein
VSRFSASWVNPTGGYSNGCVTERLPQLFAAAIVGICLALTTSAALASGAKKPRPHQKSSGCVSAVCVYHEQVPTVTGYVPVDSVKGPPVKLSKKVNRALQKHGGKEAKVLKSLATNPGLGATRVLFTSVSNEVTTPNALGAAFDLGTGPIALLGALFGGALLMAGGMALRRRTRGPQPPDATSAV